MWKNFFSNFSKYVFFILSKSLFLKNWLAILSFKFFLQQTLIIFFSLLFLPIFFATFISQIFNLNFGFYLYGLKVFKVKFLGKKIYFKYLFFHIFLWMLNWFLINFIYSFNISKNLAALFVVPFLALISFVYQKNIVFTK